MRRIKHRAFINDNKLKLESFSKALQKKIHVFNKMYIKRTNLVNGDKDIMINKLKELDTEIHQDMLEAFDDLLENNELQETAKPVSKPVNADEIIIENLVKSGKNKVRRSSLRELGYKGRLESKEHHVGKYLLKKSIFTYTYYISEKKEENRQEQLARQWSEDISGTTRLLIELGEGKNPKVVGVYLKTLQHARKLFLKSPKEAKDFLIERFAPEQLEAYLPDYIKAELKLT